MTGKSETLVPLSEMHCRTVYVIAVLTVISRCAGELVIAPQTTEANVGDTTYFNCSTNLTTEEIFWHHGLNYVYTGDPIIDPYRERFKIERTSSNLSHNLVIQSVKPSDAGEYTCVDNDGLGTRRSAYLVVLDSDPDCQSNTHPDGVIGQNIFDIPPDEVQLTCSVTYHGNIPPQLEWKNVADNTSITENVTYNVTSNNRVVYTLKLKGDISLDKSSYICQTKRSTPNQSMCISETINVLYFLDGQTIEKNVVRGEEVTCISNNNTFRCTNQWYIGETSCPLSCDATITTHVLGKYLCRLKCNVRGVDYFFDALNATVIDATTSSPPTTSGTPVAAVVIPITSVVLILVVIVAVLFVRHKKRKYKEGLERLRDEKQLERELLMARAAFVKHGESLRRNDTEKEIELLHKIKKDASLGLRKKEITGMTILCGQIFIVREKTSEIDVYDCKNFNAAPSILDVTELVSAVDICCCKTNNYLYIMDKKKGKTKEVLKISIHGTCLLNWSTKYNASGYLSATTEGNVIVTVQEKQMLLEYNSSNGKLMCKIMLPECNNPWHAVKLADGRYVVSHGILTDHLIRVCHVDKEGKVAESFGPKSGSAENQLNMPVYLAVGRSGCLVVADLFSNRVLLLDSNLKFQANVVPKYKQTFRNPKRVCLDETLLAVVIAAGNSSEINPDGEGAHKREADAADTSTDKSTLLQEAEEGTIQAFDSSKKIEEDCKLLVFNMEPLLT